MLFHNPDTPMTCVPDHVPGLAHNPTGLVFKGEKSETKTTVMDNPSSTGGSSNDVV